METPVFSAKSASRAAPPEVTPGDQQVTSSEEQQAYRMEAPAFSAHRPVPAAEIASGQGYVVDDEPVYQAATPTYEVSSPPPPPPPPPRRYDEGAQPPPPPPPPAASFLSELQEQQKLPQPERQAYEAPTANTQRERGLDDRLVAAAANLRPTAAQTPEDELSSAFSSAFGEVTEPKIAPEDEAKESYTSVTMWKKGFRQGVSRKGGGGAAPQGGMALPGMHDAVDEEAFFTNPSPPKPTKSDHSFDSSAFSQVPSSFLEPPKSTPTKPKQPPPPQAAPLQQFPEPSRTVEQPFPPQQSLQPSPPPPPPPPQVKAQPPPPQITQPAVQTPTERQLPLQTAPQQPREEKQLAPNNKSEARIPRLPGWDPESVSHRKHYEPEKVKISQSVDEFSKLVDFNRLCDSTPTLSKVTMNLRDIEHAQNRKGGTPTKPAAATPPMMPMGQPQAAPAVMMPMHFNNQMPVAGVYPVPMAYGTVPPQVPPGVYGLQQPVPLMMGAQPVAYNPGVAPVMMDPQTAAIMQQQQQQQQQQRSGYPSM